MQTGKPRKAQSAQKQPKQAVIGLSEFNRIKASAAIETRTSNIEEDRQRLKDLSQGKTQHWSNTILALRNKKEHDKFLKFEKEELERRKVDQEEAEFQSEVKKGVMDKAKKQLFERHNKVKTLHSKMLLADVLQERELQKEIDAHKREYHKEIEREFHNNVLQQCEEHDKKEAEKTRQLEAKRKQQHEVLKQQHEDFREKHVIRLMEDKIEGEIIKEKAKEQEKKARQEEEARRRKIREAQEQTRKGNEVLQEYKQQERLKELQEEEKIKMYNRQKEERERKRKDEQERKFAEKQKIRQQMIDKAVSDLAQKNEKESQRLNKDIEEARVKAENVEKEKREKIAKLKSTIDHHRDLFNRDRAIKKEKEVKEDKSFQTFWKERNKTIVLSAQPGRKPPRRAAEQKENEQKPLGVSKETSRRKGQTARRGLLERDGRGPDDRRGHRERRQDVQHLRPEVSRRMGSAGKPRVNEGKERDADHLGTEEAEDAEPRKPLNIRLCASNNYLNSMESHKMIKRQIKRISFEKEEFENAIKLPELDKMDFNEPASGYSANLAAVCNSEGLLFYALGTRVAILNRQGLTLHLGDAKNKQDNQAKHYPFAEYQQKGTGCIIEWGDGDRLIQCIEVWEQSDNPLLVVVFEDSVKSVRIRDLAAPAPSLVDNFELERGDEVVSMRLLADDILLLMANCKLKSVRGKVKVPAELLTTPLTNCTIFSPQSTCTRKPPKLCWQSSPCRTTASAPRPSSWVARRAKRSRPGHST